MKRLLLFLFILVIAVGGYYYYRQQSQSFSPPILRRSSDLKLARPSLNTASFSEVLGAATSRFLESSAELLNGATGGQAEPIINKAVNDLQETVRELPKEQYDKVKYEFCKDLL